MATTSKQAGVTRAQGWALGLASAASFMVVLDMLVVATALNTIRRDLHTSIAQLEWTVNAYTLTFAVLLMTAAAIGDRFGRRRAFAAGLGVFAMASAACALAPGVGWLIAARAVQGAGAAMVMPLGLALLNAAVPPQNRGWAMGIFGGATGLAAAVGPVHGGAITQGIAWQWIFWLNVPLGVIAIALVLRRLDESYGPRAALELPGLALATGAALGLVWGLVRGTCRDLLPERVVDRSSVLHGPVPAGQPGSGCARRWAAAAALGGGPVPDRAARREASRPGRRPAAHRLRPALAGRRPGLDRCYRRTGPQLRRDGRTNDRFRCRIRDGPARGHQGGRRFGPAR